ncbi:MAG TPA: hypothetical protein VMT24_19745 [Aggregatilineaceae bacterium]|nr:hypothetical protein [Aggregatilineaceae bacterium]
MLLLEKFGGCQVIRDQNVNPSAFKRPTYGGVFPFSTCDSNCAPYPLELLQAHADHTIIKRRVHSLPLLFEKAQTDISDSTVIAQGFQFLLGEDIPAAGQKARWFDGSDTDQRQRNLIEERNRLIDEPVRKQDIARFGGTNDTRSRQDSSFSVDQIGEAACQLHRVLFRRGITNAS